MPVEPGDRVKLTERVARARNKPYHRKTFQVDWAKRRGVVTSVGRKFTYVLWDGLLSSEHIAHKDIEGYEP